MLPPLAFKYEHADHHTYTQDPDRDAQYVVADNLRQYLWYGSAIPYFYNIARKPVAAAVRLDERDYTTRRTGY